MKAEVKKDNVVLTLELSLKEFDSIYETLGAISIADYSKLGVHQEAAETMYNFYFTLQDAVKG